MNAQNRHIIGIGLVNVDHVAFVPFWERDQKTTVSTLLEQVGGPVPIALATMARQGLAKMDLLASVGEDDDGNYIVSWLEKEGIGTGHLWRGTGRTSRSLVLVDERDGSRTVANDAGTLAAPVLSESQHTLLRSAYLLHTDGRDPETVRTAAQIVRASGGIVSWDLGTMRPGREILLDCCDIILASRRGGAGTFPAAADDPAEQVRLFLRQGAMIAGVTLGSDGVLIGTREAGVRHLPAYPVEKPVDTCGAGDVFHGAFFAAFLQGADAFEAADWAQKSAGCRIRFRGNDRGIPSRQTIENTGFPAETRPS
ncbi:MAG: sugar kinase [Armatimonadaceae bacterium]